MIAGIFRSAAALSALLISVAGLGFMHCTLQPLAGGTDTELTRTISGKIEPGGDGVAAGAMVKLIPANFDPIRGGALAARMITRADSLGRYSFNVVDTGEYTILAESPVNRASVLISGIIMRRTGVVVPIDTLRTPGAVRVRIASSFDPDYGYVYIAGTTIAAYLSDNIGSVVLVPVPAGRVPAVCYSTTLGSVRPLQVLRDSLHLASGDTATIAWAGWTRSRRIFLNTTSTGANMANTVVDFPLLITLTRSMFDFSQAQSGGQDLRFANSRGVPLDFEIESWDAPAGNAVVWVRMDTVAGNNGSQYILMDWGNAAATAVSNGAKVFDTASGFQGVWHLNEPRGQLVRDATANRFDGMPSDTAPAPTAGAIGNGMLFNGTSNCIRVNGSADGKLNFPENGRYTISSWVYMETLVDTQAQVIVSKGNEDYFLKMYYGPAGDGPRWEFAEFQEATGHWINRVAPVTVNAWKHLAGVRDGQNQYLYLDGVLVSGTPGYGKADTSEHRNTTHDVYIGRYPEYVARSFQDFCYWNGILDEVQMSDVARGADWIRLSFMNQRAENKLVVFR